MDLFEYQARDLFEAHGVPVLAAEVVTEAADAGPAAERIGAASGGVVVVKAQVKVGGRGKAGGVKLAKTLDEAVAAAEQIAALDADAIRATKRALAAPRAEHPRVDCEEQAILFESPEKERRMTEFLERKAKR